MIPVLYQANEQNFENNGIGRLSDAVSCAVSEERNGPFELEMEYPVDGEHYSDIALSCLILADPAPDRDAQLFRIYKITKPLNGIVTVYAEHVSYQLSHIPVSPFTASGAAEALQGLMDHAVEACPFDFWTDKTTQARFEVAEPASIRSRLGGNDGSILDAYGGEYEFDNYLVRLWAVRGADRGVTLRYGKNITDLTQEEHISNAITGIYPYWKSEDVLVTLPEKVIRAENAFSYPYQRTIPLDMSSYFDEQPTEEELRAEAKKYADDHALGIPTVSLSVSFVALWQTEEYKSIAPLEKVGLCDTVNVVYEKLGVSATAKIVKCKYNVLTDRYDSIELGSVRASLEKSLVSQEQETESQIKNSTSKLSSAVKKATQKITGVSGGYVVINQDANGNPFEILIMDAPNIETAVNVWRFNQNGWGHSSNGYHGDYTLAATLDGGIVADYITAGTLEGVKIIGENGSIGGWSINSKSIYKDVVDPNDATIVYRVYFQPPLESSPDKTWVLSCQKSTNGGSSFSGIFVLYSDGSAKFGKTSIDADGAIKIPQSSGGYLTVDEYGVGYTSEDGAVSRVIQATGEHTQCKVDKATIETINGYAGYSGDVYLNTQTGSPIRVNVYKGMITNVYS